MSEELKTLTLRLDPESWRALKLFSIEEGKPVTQIMRESLRTTMEKKSSPLKNGEHQEATSNVISLNRAKKEGNSNEASCRYADGWFPNKTKENQSNIDYSGDEDYLDKIKELFSIQWEHTKKGVFKIVTREGRSFYYYPKTGKWRCQGKQKYYRSLNLHSFFKKFAFKNYSDEELSNLKAEY